MSNSDVRHFPVYYKGKKVAEAFENEFSVKPGRTPMFGADGLFAFTRGAIMTDLTIKYIVPVKGTSVSFLTDTVLQNDVDIGVLVGGQVCLVTMAITENSMTSNSEKGTVEGTIKLGGGAPIVQSF